MSTTVGPQNQQQLFGVLSNLQFQCQGTSGGSGDGQNWWCGHAAIGSNCSTLTAAGALTVQFAIASLLVLAKGMWHSRMELEEWLGYVDSQNYRWLEMS